MLEKQVHSYSELLTIKDVICLTILLSIIYLQIQLQKKMIIRRFLMIFRRFGVEF